VKSEPTKIFLYNLKLFVFRSWINAPVRTILIFLGMAFGVALIQSMHSLNTSVTRSFQENITAMSGKAALTVSAGDEGFAESWVDRISATLGIQTAVPVVESRGFLALKNFEGTGVSVLGVDLLKESTIRSYKTEDHMIEDPLVFFNQPDSVIITRELSKKLNLKVNDSLPIASKSGKTVLKIRGILEPEGPALAYGGSLLLMDIDGARVVLGKENKVDRVDLILTPGTQDKEVEDRLRKILPSHFEILKPAARSEQLEEMVAAFQKMLSAFSSVALIIGCLLIANLSSIAIAQRRKTLSILLATGIRPRVLFWMLILDSTILGVFSGIFGILLGNGLTGLMIDKVTESMSLQFGMPIIVTRLDAGKPSEWFLFIAMGVFSAMASTVFAAMRASRVSPLEAMKNDSAVNLTHTPFHFPFKLFLNGTTFLAFGNLQRSPQRTILNTLTLTLGLGFTTLLLTVSSSFQWKITRWFETVLRSDLIISSYNRLPQYPMLAQPLDESMKKNLSSVEGIKHVDHESSVMGLRMIKMNYSGKNIILKAYDEPPASYHYDVFDFVEGSPETTGPALFKTQGLPVLVSSGFVNQFHVKINDQITLPTPSGEIQATIIGVVTDFASPVGVILMARSRFSKLWDDHLVNLFSADVGPGQSVEEVRARIEKEFGASQNITAFTNKEMRTSVERTLVESFRFLDSIEFLALLIALMSLWSTTTIGVLERTREFGMLRAVGLNRKGIRLLILQESLIQGLLGSFLGIGLGLGGGYLLITYFLSRQLGWTLNFRFSYGPTGVTLTLGICVAMIAGLLPAIRAGKITIREALYE